MAVLEVFVLIGHASSSLSLFLPSCKPPLSLRVIYLYQKETILALTASLCILVNSLVASVSQLQIHGTCSSYRSLNTAHPLELDGWS